MKDPSQNPARAWPAGFAVRNELRPGDVERLIQFHADVYAREYGFNQNFEVHVAEPLKACTSSLSERTRFWLVERDVRLVGCIAIVQVTRDDAQLRWFLVAPDERGIGLGRALLEAAVQFCRDHGYRTIFLWTVDLLSAAARLYRAAGFVKLDEAPSADWGVRLVEEKYALTL